MHRVLVLAPALVLLAFTHVSAQSVGGSLSTLLTEQHLVGGLIPDVAAAEATRDTVASLFLTDLSTLPVSSSSGGFVYRLNKQLGLVERASDAFGPFFADRVLRNSRGQLTLGIGFHYNRFTSLQGADLEGGTFPTNTARLAGTAEPFSVDTLQLELRSRTTSFFTSFGITDRLAVGGTVPITTVRFTGTRMRAVNAASALQSSQRASATGLGDVTVNARYLLAGDGIRGLSAGTDIRFPTGEEADLLGAGSTAVRLIGVGTWEEGQLALHVNGGVGLGGISDEQFWNLATTFAATPRVTLVGEIMGRRLDELSRVSPVYEPHATVAGLETMRWLPTESGVHTMFLVTGAKWNLASSLLLNANVLVRLTDAGLRSRVTPTVSLDYAFER
jgi:hypothetical protein